MFKNQQNREVVFNPPFAPSIIVSACLLIALKSTAWLDFSKSVYLFTSNFDCTSFRIASYWLRI